MNHVYAYIRTSSAKQNIDRQLMSMKEQGVPEANIFFDYRSCKLFNRPVYKRGYIKKKRHTKKSNRPAFMQLLQTLKSGDLLLIHSIDRLGRNYNELRLLWRIITKNKMVDIKVLDMPLLDTAI